MVMVEASNSHDAQCSHPLVSIVTPTYNQAAFLRETLNSVLAQTYPRVEYIVLDDGSTDATAEILRQERRLTIAETHHNMGQARTLNKGWALARGKYIGYLSSDDLIYPQAIARLVDLLESNETIVCAFPDCDLIDIRSRVIKRNICKAFSLEDLVVLQECHIGPGALFRRDALEAVGGWDPALRLAPDREFWIRLAGLGRFAFCRETLAGYRMHAEAISYRDVSEDVGREYIRVLDQYFFGRLGTPEPSVLARRNEAYGYATLILARNCLRAGRWNRGLALYRQACLLHPPLGGLSTKIRLLRNVVSKPARTLLARMRSLFRKA